MGSLVSQSFLQCYRDILVVFVNNFLYTAPPCSPAHSQALQHTRQDSKLQPWLLGFSPLSTAPGEISL